MVINWDYIDVAECECNKRVMMKEKQKPPTVTSQRKPLSEPVVVKALKKREMRQKKERKKEREKVDLHLPSLPYVVSTILN